MTSKRLSVLAVGALLAGGCVVSTGDEMDDVESEAYESVHPAPPPDHDLSDQPNIHLQPCFEVEAPCNGGAVCTETKWGLYCMHSDETRIVAHH